MATKVSVGVPIFNAEATISRALDALISQTHRELEIIICDDGSSDGTRDICVNYVRLDSRIQYHRSEINRGIPTTFAWALSLSSAEFFMWASHDDYWFPEYIATCLVPLQKNSEIVLSATITESVNESGGTQFIDFGLTTLGMSSSARYRAYRKKVDTKTDIGGLFYGVYRKSILSEFSPMPPIIANDHVVLARLALKGCFVTTQKKLMQKYFGGVSKSHRDNGRAQRIPHSVYVTCPYLIRELYFVQAILTSDGIDVLRKLRLMAWSLIQFSQQSGRVFGQFSFKLYNDVYFLRKALISRDYTAYQPKVLPRRVVSKLLAVHRRCTR